MSEVQIVDKENSERFCVKTSDSCKLSTKYFFYTWTILGLDNFFACIQFSKPKILSPVFEFAGAKWRLWLQSVYKKDKLDRINVRLMQTEKCDSVHYIKYKISFLNADGTLVSKETSSLFGESHWGHRLSFKHHEKNIDGSSVVINDKVTIHCELLVLSSEVTSSDQISSSHSKSLKQERLDKAMSHPTAGLIQLQSTKIPKVAKKHKKPVKSSRSKDANYVYNSIEPIFVIILCFSAIFFLLVVIQEDLINKHTINGRLNMREVDELIIDSTLKILHIAEVLNLTQVKIKSSELLEWYNNTYNLSKSIYMSSISKNSTLAIFDHSHLNASLDIHGIANVDVNSTKYTNKLSFEHTNENGQ